MFTSLLSKATAFFTTKATASSKTSPRRRESATPASAPAPRGWITIATASWICLSPTMCNGRKRAIYGARSTARRSLTARPNHTKELPASCFTIWAGRVRRRNQKAGLGDPNSKSLGVTVIDFDSDGWPDIFVSNDTQPNKLYHNNQNGTFTEQGMSAGVAYGEDGVARGAMGVDWADYDRTGRAASAGRKFLQSDAGALSQRRQRLVCG